MGTTHNTYLHAFRFIEGIGNNTLEKLFSHFGSSKQAWRATEAELALVPKMSRDKIALIVASHNEHSNLYTTRLLDKKGLPHNHRHVHFSQLYGMSDNITFNLARSGCSVSKYLPFGPIKDVIPYLMRRAQENSSVSGQTGRELSLIKKEMKRRRL